MPSGQQYVTRQSLGFTLGGMVRPFQIAEDVDSTGTTQPYLVQHRGYLKLAARLQSGTSATLDVQATADGGATWTTVGSFTLDTVGALVESSGLIRILGDQLRCNVSAISGVVDVYGGE